MDSPPRNGSLQFGFEWDRDYLTPILMTQQLYMPILGTLTVHPIIFYLLMFENRSMLSSIRILNFITYVPSTIYATFQLILVIDEWSFCFFFRVLPLPPYAALYCEGPLCRFGWDSQLLMALFSAPIVTINIPFDFLVVVMHQMFVPVGSKLKLPMGILVLMASLHISLIAANIIAWGVLGKECDDSELLKEEPEIAWLRERGGTIFMFGRPGSYLGLPLILYAVTLCILTPAMLFFTGDAMRIVAKTNLRSVSTGTQAATRWMFGVFLVQLAIAAVNDVAPLLIMFSFMILDGSWIPGPILAFLFRFIAVILFNTKSYVFGIFLLLKNPHYRKLPMNKVKKLIGRKVEETRVKSKSEPSKSQWK